MATHPPTCPYCSQFAQLVKGDFIYPHRTDLATLNFWHCECRNAYVGCHKGGDGLEPLGRLADRQLRMMKSMVHAQFDREWLDAIDVEIAERKGYAPKGIKARHRRAAYMRLATDLGIPFEECHIGMFDVETCKRALAICKGWKETA